MNKISPYYAEEPWWQQELQHVQKNDFNLNRTPSSEENSPHDPQTVSAAWQRGPCDERGRKQWMWLAMTGTASNMAAYMAEKSVYGALLLPRTHSSLWVCVYECVFLWDNQSNHSKRACPPKKKCVWHATDGLFNQIFPGGYCLYWPNFSYAVDVWLQTTLRILNEARVKVQSEGLFFCMLRPVVYLSYQPGIRPSHACA